MLFLFIIFYLVESKFSIIPINTCITIILLWASLGFRCCISIDEWCLQSVSTLILRISFQSQKRMWGTKSYHYYRNWKCWKYTRSSQRSISPPSPFDREYSKSEVWRETDRFVRWTNSFTLKWTEFCGYTNSWNFGKCCMMRHNQRCGGDKKDQYGCHVKTKTQWIQKLWRSLFYKVMA